MNLPNILSSLRLFSIIPLYIALSNGLFITSFLIFSFASLTDFFDGYFARKFNQETEFGALIDLLADKVLTSGVLIILVSSLDSFLLNVSAIIIISRDLIISHLRIYIISKKQNINEVKARMSGKIKTLILMFSLSFLILAPYNYYLSQIGTLLICLSALVSIFSLLSYIQIEKN